jgi:hypothetical protein
MAASRSQYVATAAERGDDLRRDDDDDQPADESERHDLQRFTDSERRELVRCRACGRKTTVGGINPYEICGARAGPEAGTRLASMAGVPGGQDR